MKDVFAKLPVTFGRYRVIRRLGAGGMGVVYLAEDTRLRNRKTAIKIPLLKQEEISIQRFQREAEATAILEHPNICPVYDVGQSDGFLYLAMKYVEGEPLSDHVGPGKIWDPKTAVSLIRKLAETIQFAHDCGIVHRDVKPANIMLTAETLTTTFTEPILMDFGLAKFHDDPSLTEAGRVFGTPHYMPLEQARGDLENIGPRSDVYSLGVILFQLLSGDLPFHGSTPMEVLTTIATQPVPTVRATNPEIDAQLEKICAIAMAKEPEDRYPTARHFSEALCRWAAAQVSLPIPIIVGYTASAGSRATTVPVASHAPTETRSIDHFETMAKSGLHRKRRTPRQSRIPLVAVSCCTIVLTIAVAWFLIFGGITERSPTTQPAERRNASANHSPTSRPPRGLLPSLGTSAPPTRPIKEPPAGEERVLKLPNGNQMWFCYIPSGEQQLGSPPREQVSATQEFNRFGEAHGISLEAQEGRITFRSPGFWMAKTEMTQSQWQALMGNNPSVFDGSKPNHLASGIETSDFPVENVTWFEAQDCVAKLNQQTSSESVFGNRSRIVLPHEDHWEYAYRGGKGNQQEYYWGGTLQGDFANMNGRRPFGTAEVGQYKNRTTMVGEYSKVAPHPWGLQDMCGNVWEWCDNWYTSEEKFRVLRGGAWANPAVYGRGAHRNIGFPNSKSSHTGFRVAIVYE